MALVVPNPTVPTNGQSLDATPLLANLQAVYQAIQSFDASQIAAGTLTASAFNASINPNTLLNETIYPFVSTGLVWSTVSGLNGNMTSGVLYYNGIRVSVNSVASNAFAASKDTYVDIDVNGNITYQAVTNNAASPAITANSIRVAIVVTSGAAITFINQGQIDTTISGFAPVISSISLTHTDSLGNIIYPTDQNRKLLGYRAITTTNFPTTSTTATQITGLTCPVIIPGIANRKVKVSSRATYLYNTTANNRADLTVYNGTPGSGTLLGKTGGVANSSGSVNGGYVEGLQFTSGTQTYNSGLHATGTGTANIDSGAGFPAWIKVELE